VETVHSLIETEFYEIENFADKDDFMERLIHISYSLILKDRILTKKIVAMAISQEKRPDMQ